MFCCATPRKIERYARYESFVRPGRKSSHLPVSAAGQFCSLAASGQSGSVKLKPNDRFGATNSPLFGQLPPLGFANLPTVSRHLFPRHIAGFPQQFERPAPRFTKLYAPDNDAQFRQTRLRAVSPTNP